MSTEVRNLEPKSVWNHFEDLNAVPRPSKKEEKVIAFITDFAKSLNLDFTVDAVGNVIVRKPASKGMEDRKMVVLQSHLDMVHQKNGDTEFDFDTQGIQSYIDGDWVTAKGTTLGADNGMGVAAIMAVLSSDDIAHPELEALFTIDEETGMTGAHGLKANVLKGEILMNLDTEEDDELSIGCAGGIDINIKWDYVTEKLEEGKKAFDLHLTGLKGGHSGMDIIKCRANANKVLIRILRALDEQVGIGISEIDGGSLRNAIPREAKCTIVCDSADVELLREICQEEIEMLQSEFASTDPNMALSVEQAVLPLQIMNLDEQSALIMALSSVHDGIKRMSPDVEDLVETSNNVARVELKGGELNVLCLTRSDREYAKLDMADTVSAPFLMIGADVEQSGSYPGWKLDPNAKMLGMMKDLYKELFHEEPNVMACHAGLECGLLGQHYPEMEMISFGPTIRHAHSPDEKVNIKSVSKFWNYFLEALKRVPKKD